MFEGCQGIYHQTCSWNTTQLVIDADCSSQSTLAKGPNTMPGPAIEPKLLGELAVVIIKAVSTPNPASRTNLIDPRNCNSGSHSSRLPTSFLTTGLGQS